MYGTSCLNGNGGIVGSRVNMSLLSKALIHKARLSTSCAMGPIEDRTIIKCIFVQSKVIFQWSDYI